MNWWVYILKCADETYYAGKTNDLAKRIKQHNGIITGGAKYTRARRPVQLVYQSSCNSNADACKQEAYIKSLSRKQKVQLIVSTDLKNHNTD